LAFVEETSPAYVMGGFQAMLAATRILPKAVAAFRTGSTRPSGRLNLSKPDKHVGDGIRWHEHDPDLFLGDRAVLPARVWGEPRLVQSWIPALDGVEAKLRAGGKVADVGCGYGASTIIMAEAFPKSQFWGFDYHEPSIRHAREMAAKSGLSACPTGSPLRSRRRRTTRALTTTWSVTLTACTTWATRSGLLGRHADC